MITGTINSTIAAAGTFFTTFTVTDGTNSSFESEEFIVNAPGWGLSTSIVSDGAAAPGIQGFTVNAADETPQEKVDKGFAYFMTFKAGKELFEKTFEGKIKVVADTKIGGTGWNNNPKNPTIRVNPDSTDIGGSQDTESRMEKATLCSCTGV